MIDDLLSPEQVYSCLWSHAGGVLVHIHYVVQPATRQLMDHYGTHGPMLQVTMFENESTPAAASVDIFAQRARAAFASRAAA